MRTSGIQLRSPALEAGFEALTLEIGGGARRSRAGIHVFEDVTFSTA
jgi:hypothetical protein